MMTSTMLLLLDITLTTCIATILSVVGENSVDERHAGKSCYCLGQTLEKIHNPVSAIFYMDGNDERILVVEQRGVVSRYDTAGFRIDTFLDIRDQVVTSENVGESRGLLSFVLDPLFHLNKNVYAYYIRNDQGKEYAYVSMFQAKYGTVDKFSERFLTRIYQPFVHGNGGPMLFGDDGNLYIFTGDGGEDDDHTGRAQNLNSFHGKVLRIDVRKQEFTKGESGVARNYAIPKNNPFVNKSNVREEIFALGIRNMWGCSVDSAARRDGTGRIFCAETGTNKYDEINIIESGRNYGWNIVEGTKCRNITGCAPIENEGRPIFEFSHTSTHALVGGYVYRGDQLVAQIQSGSYIYGDILNSKTYLLKENTIGEWSSQEWEICESKSCPDYARELKLSYLLAFAQDNKGELYLLMTDSLVPTSDGGKILKLLPPNSSDSRMTSFKIFVLAAVMVLQKLLLT